MTLLKPWLAKTDPLMPPYPYGVNVDFPEANYGLYGGSTIKSGSKISKGRNKGKTMRKWFPNIRLETVRSEALKQDLHIPVRARIMRTIRKCGGLDEYLIGEKPARIKELGLLGWKLRYLVMKTPAMQAKFKEQRIKLGLPTHDPINETFDAVWNDPERRTALLQHQDEAWDKLQSQLTTWEKHVDSQWRTQKEGKLNPTLRRLRPSSIVTQQQITIDKMERRKVPLQLKKKSKSTRVRSVTIRGRTTTQSKPNETAPSATSTENRGGTQDWPIEATARIRNTDD